MAQLPPDGTWIMQELGGQVVLFHRHTEEELIRFDPSSAHAAAQAQGDIHVLTQLDDQQKAFAHFWSGYFYAHGGG